MIRLHSSELQLVESSCNCRPGPLDQSSPASCTSSRRYWAEVAQTKICWKCSKFSSFRSIFSIFKIYLRRNCSMPQPTSCGYSTYLSTTSCGKASCLVHMLKNLNDQAQQFVSRIETVHIEWSERHPSGAKSIELCKSA